MATQNFSPISITRKNPSTLRDWWQSIQLYRVAIMILGALFVMAGSFVIGMTDIGILAVAGALGIGVTLSILARPHLGLYILIIFTYTNLSTVLNDAFSIPSVNKILVALILVAVLGTRVVIQRKPLLFRSSEGAIFFYISVTIASTVLTSGIDTETFGDILDIVKDFLIIFIIVQLTTEEDAWKNMQWILIGCAIFLSVLTWYQFLMDDFSQTFYGLALSRADSVEGALEADLDFDRVSGPIGDPNFYAQILVMIIPLAMYRFLTDPSRFGRMIGLGALCIIGGAIIFTYSRITLLVMILIIGLILFERRVDFYKVVIGTWLVMVIVFPVLPESFTARMATIVGIDAGSAEQDDVSAQGRLSEAIVATQMFQDYPILGIGYTQYGRNYQSYSAFLGLDKRIGERQAHSLYLEIAAETGVVGLTTFSIALFFLFRSGVEARQILYEIEREDLVPWVAAFQFALLAYLLNSIFLHDSFSRYLRLTMGFLVSSTAMATALRAKYYEQRQQSQSVTVRSDDVLEAVVDSPQLP